MKRVYQSLGVVLVAAAALAMVSPISLAGRSGGPVRTLVNVPAGQSVFLDVAFDAGPAVVTVNGNPNVMIQVYIYDSDGHVTAGIGPMTSKTARVNVYRPGMFRVEVVNAGIRDDMVTVATN